MLPQHGGVPNFTLRIPGPIIALLILVLVSGGMLSLSLYLNLDPGDTAARSRADLSLIITFLLAVLILLAGLGRWIHPHLWKHGNSQRLHRERRSEHRHHHHHHHTGYRLRRRH